MEQEPDQARRDDDKASVGGASSLELNFLDDDEEGADTLAGTIEPAEDETSTLEPPSAFMNAAHNLPESSSPGKMKMRQSNFQLILSAGEKKKAHAAYLCWEPCQKKSGKFTTEIMKTEQAVVWT